MTPIEAAATVVGGSMILSGLGVLGYQIGEWVHGRHRQAAKALQGGAGLPGADPGDAGAGQAGDSYYPGPLAFGSINPRAYAAAGGTGAGVVAQTGVAPPLPNQRCLLCSKARVVIGGLCADCAGSVVGGSGSWTVVNTTNAAPGPAVTAASIRAAAAQILQARHAPGMQEPLPRADMQVVDLIGWRIWRVLGGYLGSITAEAIWLPGEPMEAAVVEDHGAAANGIHVFKTMAGAIREAALYASRAEQHTGYAIGSVLLWGDVVEHERGYRAERAMILSIDDLMWQGKPPWHEETKRALAFLRERYGVGAHSEAPARGDDTDGRDDA